MPRGSSSSQASKKRKVAIGDHVRARKPMAAPWPRDEGIPFSGHGIDGLSKQRIGEYCDIQRAYDAPWGIKESLLYNIWLKVTFRPTRFICPRTLGRLGIRDMVGDMLHRIGIGSLASQHYPLYPELSVQFFSSVEMACRTDEDGTLASSYFIYYQIRGWRYELSISQLCSVFGFDATREGTQFPEIPHSTLWKAIGISPEGRRDRKVARIHNPVLRVVAKILCSIFFGREETSTVTKPELAMLHFGLPESAHVIYGDEPIPPVFDTNLGFIFADTLVQRKTRTLRIKSTAEDHMGSLLTPIFIASGVPLDHEIREDAHATLDARHFRSVHILSGDDSTYEFSDSRDVVRRIQLPVDGFMAPISAAALKFQVPNAPPSHPGESSTTLLRGPVPPQRDVVLSDSSDSADDYHFEERVIPEELSEGLKEMWRVEHRNAAKRERMLSRAIRRMKDFLQCHRAPHDGAGSSRGGR